MKKITRSFLILCAAVTWQVKAQYIPQSVQLAHNSADTTISTVKVWVNDTVWINALSFQQASPKLTFAAGVHTLGISLLTATAQAQSIVQHTFDFSQGIDAHFLIINGINGNAGYPLFIQDYADPALGVIAPSEANFFMNNGCTSCGVLSVFGSSSAQITTVTPVNAITYTSRGMVRATAPSNFGPFNQTFTLSVNSGTFNYGTYTLPLQNYYQQFSNVLMNVSSTQTAKATNKFRIAVVPVSGGSLTPLTELVNTTSVPGVEQAAGAFSFFPNPAANELTVNVNDITVKSVSVNVADMHGRVLFKELYGISRQKPSFTVATQNLAPGVYFLQLHNGLSGSTIKFVKQ